ncbi:OmpA family protein [Parasediminibacterium paludis]|uniref:OmpA family protein n=1 Tax=Parasediminibacterium paludis TaxID=908966 RepID=A0ABV8PTN2_9BACT
MTHIHLSTNKILIVMLSFLLIGFTTNAQTIKRVQPSWWFGESGAANFNNYRGTTQMLNQNLLVPTAFHKGSSIKPYASLLAEYRPGKILGGMLNVAFDNRGGAFDAVVAPCNCPANLSTKLSYITIEPSLRIAPFASAFYVFAGPTIAINLSKEFTYMQEKQTEIHADFNDIRKTMFGAQAGLGVDIPLSAKASPTQMTLSPFASFQTDLFDQPRTVETWAIYTIRAGIALKFGSKKVAVLAPLPGISKPDTITNTVTNTITVNNNTIQFSVRAPKVVPLNRRVKETFPLRNSVFFDINSSNIPNRYVYLTPSQAITFKESNLQNAQPENLNTGRSARQLMVYHNILNIIGDRLRNSTQSTIILVGSSDNNPTEGKLMAENVKEYLVSNFGINSPRITTEGRGKPIIPSEQPGATKDLVLLREGDRRVDIMSNSPELLLQVGGENSDFFKPVQISAVQQDPLDSHVILSVDGASDQLKVWSVDITDEQGIEQHYGPYITDQASIPGKTILGSNQQGNYKVVMTGETKTGQIIMKESTVSLIKMDDPKQEGLRYSILFDFDKYKTIDSYTKFLTEIVTPLIPENGTVIIHGHTDIIGDEKYNHTLSHNRANQTRQIIEKASTIGGKKGITFEVIGYGKDASRSPFENNLPEERFYNRTVIIDIIPSK